MRCQVDVFIGFLEYVPFVSLFLNVRSLGIPLLEIPAIAIGPERSSDPSFGRMLKKSKAFRSFDRLSFLRPNYALCKFDRVKRRQWTRTYLTISHDGINKRKIRNTWQGNIGLLLKIRYYDPGFCHLFGQYQRNRQLCHFLNNLIQILT